MIQGSYMTAFTEDELTEIIDCIIDNGLNKQEAYNYINDFVREKLAQN